jgi:transposase-like protein
MTKRQDRDAIYVKRQFDAEIIVLCVRWYITYLLS